MIYTELDLVPICGDSCRSNYNASVIHEDIKPVSRD
jgi:hypothetical protein